MNLRYLASVLRSLFFAVFISAASAQADDSSFGPWSFTTPTGWIETKGEVKNPPPDSNHKFYRNEDGSIWVVFDWNQDFSIDAFLKDETLEIIRTDEFDTLRRITFRHKTSLETLCFSFPEVRSTITIMTSRNPRTSVEEFVKWCEEPDAEIRTHNIKKTEELIFSNLRQLPSGI